MELLSNWREEKRSAYLYRILATIEINPVHKKLFLDLSQLAEKQAQIWEQQLKKAKVAIPTYSPDLRALVIIFLVKCFGARTLRIALAALKIRGMSIYQSKDYEPNSLPNPVIGSEQQHRSISAGNNIRAAIFGINDGLVSNTSLILGILGAHASSHFILISGITGLLAGACSMAAGEYISVRSQREMLEYQLELEAKELELYPEEEAEELALIYEARGLPREEAQRVANLLIQKPEKALATLAREELGINPDDLVSPWGAAIASFCSFVMGAFIPLIPFFIDKNTTHLISVIVLTGISLFTVGAILSIFTQRSLLWSGLRMLFIGFLAGALTYFIGSLFSL